MEILGYYILSVVLCLLHYYIDNKNEEHRTDLFVSIIMSTIPVINIALVIVFIIGGDGRIQRWYTFLNKKFRRED